MSLRDRIGIDLGNRLCVEDGVRWAADNGVRFVDAQIDLAPNALETFDEARCARVRDLCASRGVRLGLHTLSAVNTAEVSPFLRDAADRYLEAYMDAAVRLGAEWIVVHAGYHFSSDRPRRMEASRARLARATGYAEKVGATLLLENLNREPDLAEVHYLAHTLEECRYYFDAIDSPSLGWSFTINHATLEPEGIEGFVAGMPMHRCAEVRLADNNGEHEVHLYPGEGIVDFGATFALIEGTGFTGRYTNAFGDLDDRLRARDELVAMARAAGVAGA